MEEKLEREDAVRGQGPAPQPPAVHRRIGQSLVAGPGGEIIHDAGRGREIFPLRLDLDYVRDVRANGWHGLGQPLKSFRDSKVQFPPYTEGYASGWLEALGPLTVPGRSRGGS